MKHFDDGKEELTKTQLELSFILAYNVEEAPNDTFFKWISVKCISYQILQVGFSRLTEGCSYSVFESFEDTAARE